MDFKKLVEYQTIDQELIAIQREARSAEESKQYVYYNKLVKEANEQLNKLGSDGQEIMAEYSELLSRIDSLNKDLKDYEGISEGVQEVGELEYYIKNMEQLVDKVAALEKEAGVLKKRIEETNSQYKKLWNQGVSATKKLHDVTPAYRAKAAEFKPKMDEKVAKLQEIAKEVDPKAIEVYNSLKQANKLPAFVEYNPDIPQCGRCFMELANDTRSKLKKPGDYVECPNCRRILYIPED